MTDLETSGFVDGGTARGVKLHSGYSVLIATFLGSPMAGCIVMAINFFRLGMKRQGWLTLLGGLGATGLLIAAACAVPDSWHGSNIAFLALQMGGMSFAANKLQGGILKEHTDAGGVLASRWKAAGIGLLMCVVLFGSIIGVAFLTTGPSGTRMAVGSSEIYFSGSATKADAEALATDLKASGFLSEDQAMTIALSKDAGGFTVSFVVTDEAIGNPAVIAGFRAIGKDLAAGAMGRPLTVWLCDDAMSRKKKIVIE